MKTSTEFMTMQEYWMGNFFEVLGKEPELYRACMIAKIKSHGEKSTLEQPDNFREFISCWIFVHCFIIHESAIAVEEPELRHKVQQMAMSEIGRVCHDDEAIEGILEEFMNELQACRDMRDPGFSFSPGAMLSWFYCKRLDLLFRLKHYSPSPSELPSRSELALITRLTDDTIQMTLQSFNHLLEG